MTLLSPCFFYILVYLLKIKISHWQYSVQSQKPRFITFLLVCNCLFYLEKHDFPHSPCLLTCRVATQSLSCLGPCVQVWQFLHFENFLLSQKNWVNEDALRSLSIIRSVSDFTCEHISVHLLVTTSSEYPTRELCSNTWFPSFRFKNSIIFFYIYKLSFYCKRSVSLHSLICSSWSF